MVFDKYKLLKEQAALVSAQQRQSGDVVLANAIPESTPLAIKLKEAVDSNANQEPGLFAEEPAQKNLEGSAQVVVVRDKMSHTPEIVGQLAPQSLAGGSPHAPDPARRGRKRRGTKDSDLNIRMTSDMKTRLGAKCSVLETYPSAYVLELIAADLSLPVDEYRVTRDKKLKKAFADLRVAFDDCGVNLNQMAKATNSGQPCALTRGEIDDALKNFKKGCALLESLRPS